MVKIPYGRNQRGEKVFVADANKQDSYTCLECGQPLVLRAGEFVVKHFAHFRAKKLCPLLTRREDTGKRKTDPIPQVVQTDPIPQVVQTDPIPQVVPSYIPEPSHRLTVPVKDGLVWVSRRAVLKRVINEEVSYCPDHWIKTGQWKSVGVDTCYGCRYFLELRYPLDRESDLPPVVVCRGHFSKEAENKTIFDFE